ncbi:MAG: NUDIX hydrolase, partial [Rhizomicrobium sp.]
MKDDRLSRPSALDAKAAVAPVPAATVLLVRDACEGLEVFMVKRHHEVAFAGGALVFPGGKTARDDYETALGDLCDGAEGLAPEMRALAVAAIREAFEEAGVLIARDADTGDLIGEGRLGALQPCRERIETGQIRLVEFLREERLRLACDRLAPFAHWITPKSQPKRFDTHFFLARTPAGQTGRHCGRESVDSLWVRPQDAVANPERWKLMFPTRLNLMKLSRAQSVEEALAAARAAPPVTVEPWIESGADGKFVHIPADAGYEITRLPLCDTL